MSTETLVHMSTGTGDTLEVTAGNDSLFGGVFCTPDGQVAGHGNTRYEIELDKDDILDTLNRVEWETVTEVLRYETDASDEDEIEAVFDAIESEELDEDGIVAPLLNVEQEQAYLSWELQRLRGVVALVAGYKAVECTDEHGGVTLLMDGIMSKVE